MSVSAVQNIQYVSDMACAEVPIVSSTIETAMPFPPSSHLTKRIQSCGP